MSDGPQREIDVLLREERRFEPPAGFQEHALVKDRAPYEAAASDRESFWEGLARELHWFKPWNRVLEWEAPFAKWFVGGSLNVSYNCLDRHLETWRANKAALIWEGEPGDRKVLTYRQLHREVCLFANALRSLGVQRGDRVAIYMPMVPEAAVAMLACARLGAPHSVVFGGFSARSLRDRIIDAGAKVVITGDGGYRRGQIVPLKRTTDEAIEGLDFVESVVIVRRRGGGDGDESFTHVVEGRDHWYHRLIQEASAECPAEEMDAEDPLFILYTSGTTGQPKGIVHSTGGYLTQVAATTKWVFDLKDEDVFWCTADIGWITGHSYVVYGPLALGATIMMYEGAPDWPDRGGSGICARSTASPCSTRRLRPSGRS
jgi:acetyl-CoA synthetase